MAFTHLHVHTEYSLLDSGNKIKNYVKRVKELGMTAAAITDHGVMYGVIDFYKAAREAGIKPIIGCEVYVSTGSRFEKKANDMGDKYYHLILLAENNKGYANLSKMVSRSFTEGFYYKPRVDMELLEEFHEGLIASSACLAGEVARNIVRDDIKGAEEAALRLQECFGKGNFFLELQDHGYDNQKKVNQELMKMSKKLDIPLIATNDVHYTSPDDVEAHDILLCLQTGKELSDENRLRYPGGQFYVKSEEEMRKLFPYAQEAIDNTQKIADRCNVEIEFGHTKLPRFEVPEGYDSWTYLNKLCDDGMKERYPNDDGTLRKRMEYELNTIRQMGFVDYFLIVWDYINYAREHDIPVGPGRGSAAGSVVAYCLHITNIDPVKYNLLFERFLNPERVSMPDIDVDFCFERRKEVIDYVTGKYGKEKVVQIITFGTMAARGVLKDVGRVMGIPYTYVDSLSKMVPSEPKMTLTKAMNMNPELKERYEKEEQAKKLIDMSLRLEGLPRNPSVHAAGVVICSAPAEDLIPLAMGKDGVVVTQFTMTTVEELGLLKMDFLALKTLTVIKNAARMAGVSIDSIDYNDEAVYRFISSGKTRGVFQLETGGMQSFMKELKPKSFEDVIAGISLYRPGPMDFIPKYIAGKNDPGSIRYDCPQLEPILEPTYGCIVYQEQVMQIVRDLGGYTLGRSDLVRRAMSKKKEKVMEQERKNFVYGNKDEGVPGCISKGISEETANHIYDTMMDFAKYAFNKSHAACYAVVAYQTAWLKYYYPTEFMAALISSVYDKPDKVSGYIFSCREMNIRVLPPDINLSESDFSVTGTDIRYGLAAIRGIGKSVVSNIIDDRNRNGKFEEFYEFIERGLSVKDAFANKKVLESLILSGAMDGLHLNRCQMMATYEAIIKKILNDRKSTIKGQMSLFDFVDDGNEEYEYPALREYPTNEKLRREKEVLGVYVSGHPLDEYTGVLKRTVTKYAVQFMPDEDGKADGVSNGEGVIIAGQVSSVKNIVTKKQELMSFVELEDASGTVEVIVFPKNRQKYANLLADDAKIIVEGRVSVEEGKPPKVILSSARPLENTPVPDNEYRTGSYGAEPSVSVYEDGNRPQEQECPPAAESLAVFSLNEEPRRKPSKIWVLFNTCASLMEDKPFIDDLCARYPGEDLIIFYIKDSGRKFGRKAGICRNMAQELINRYSYRNVKLPASGK